MVTLVKPPTTLDEQTTLLIGRGLEIADQDACRRLLYDTSYYRLTGYARQFQLNPRAGNNTFVQGVTLDRLGHIMALDADLAMALMRCLGIVEKVVRARFAYELAHAHGETAFYLEPASYLSVTPGLDAFLDRVRAELIRAKSATVTRYAPAGDLSQVPVWVAFELLSFGTLSKMLEYLTNRGPRDLVAGSFSEQKALFPSTIHSLAVLRNRCAHHGQLWHRPLTIQTPIVRKQKRGAPAFDPQGVYPAVLAARRLIRGIPGGQASVAEVERLIDADAEFARGILQPSPR
jgi:abortive infection bacteriophage resistance protein